MIKKNKQNSENQKKVKAKDIKNQVLEGISSYCIRFVLFAIAVYIGTQRR